MASPARTELNQWLQTIEIKNQTVLDVGGIALPVRNKTKIWQPSDYKILDIIKENDKLNVADYVYDLNLECPVMDFDVAFCLEVMPFIYNPVAVMKNIAGFLKPGGLLYISFHQIFVHTKSDDFLRFTRLGVIKLLEVSGFKILEILPRLYRQDIRDGEVGHLVKAIKI